MPLGHRSTALLLGGCLLMLLVMVTTQQWSTSPTITRQSSSNLLQTQDDQTLAHVRTDLGPRVLELEDRLERTLETMERVETLSRTMLDRIQQQNMSKASQGASVPVGAHGEIDTNQLLLQLHNMISQRIHQEQIQQEGGDAHRLDVEDFDTLRPGQIQITRNMDCVDGYDPNRLIVYLCDPTQEKQFWRFTKRGQVKTSENWCIDASGAKEGDILRVQECRDDVPHQRFRFIPAKEYTWNVTGILQLVNTNLCLTAPSPFSDDVASVRLFECEKYRCLQGLHFHAFHHDSERTVADVLSSEHKPPVRPVYSYKTMNGQGGRILCWIMTNPRNHNSKAVTVRDTWGRHCDKLVFMTSKPANDLDTWIAKLDKPESRDMLWEKSKQAWMRAYNDHLDNYDWFIRGDDDTYMMMDNVRQFLDDKAPDDSLFFGRYFLGHLGDDRIPFYSGGPGTILSRGALRKLGDAVTGGEAIFNDWDTFADDMELGISMKRVGVPAVDTLDAEGRNLFIALGLDVERSMRKEDDPSNWYWKYCPTAKEGKRCCSTRWLGTHYATPQEMQTLEDLHLNGCEAAGHDML